jgi:hypothetical protein
VSVSLSAQEKSLDTLKFNWGRELHTSEYATGVYWGLDTLTNTLQPKITVYPKRMVIYGKEYSIIFANENKSRMIVGKKYKYLLSKMSVDELRDVLLSDDTKKIVADAELEIRIVNDNTCKIVMSTPCEDPLSSNWVRLPDLYHGHVQPK